MMTSTDGTICLKVTARSLMDQALDEAVRSLTPLASARRQGILVSQLAPGSFVVAASPDVPFGQSMEEALW